MTDELRPEYRLAIEALRDLARCMGDRNGVERCESALNGDPAGLLRCGVALGSVMHALGNINIIPGTVAPRTSAPMLTVDGVAITEEGTAEHLPLVDLNLRGPDGTLYVAVLTGRTVCAIAAAIRGINQRNHGRPEP